jgi:hypothetical protein
VNVVEIGPTACKSRTTSNARDRRVTEDAKANQRGRMSANDKVGVRSLCLHMCRLQEREQPELGRSGEVDWVCRSSTRHHPKPSWVGSALPGIEPTAYRIESTSREHGNLDRSVEQAMLDKLPSPVTSSTRGRASVVVRARESRAHGEGRQ